MEKRKQYMKPEVELIIVDRLMDHTETVLSASKEKGESHDADAKLGCQYGCKYSDTLMM